jgi:hypothetical protein
VHCNYQAHFFTRPPLLQSLVSSEEVGDWLKRPSNRWNRGIDLSPVVLRAVADYILERDAQKEGASIVGDKSPNSLLDGDAVKLMHQVYPDARLIYIIRDGRDAAISHRFQTFIDRLENLNAEDLRIRADFAQDPEPFLRAERSIFTSKALRQAAEGWVQNVEQTDRMGKDLYGPHYISLRYEDMLTATWDEMSRLWAFLDADLDIPGLKDAIQDELSRNPDADWQRQKDSQIGEAIEKGKKGNWRQMFTSEDRTIFQKIAGETLKTWHYSV